MSYDLLFMGPMILQFINLYYISKMVGVQLRVLSLDYFYGYNQQGSWISWSQIKIYIVALFYISMINRIVFSKFFIFVVSASVWVPQIYRNTKKGLKQTPNIDFVIASSLHSLYIPMYFKYVEGNILFLEPSSQFVFFIVLWVFLQILVLKIQ